MTTSDEARVWQAMGATAIVGGGALFLATIRLYGVAYADPAALAVGLAASFVMLAGVITMVGILALLAQRVMHHATEQRKAAKG